MANLIIDVGNTNCKLAVFVKNKLLHTEKINSKNLVKHCEVLVKKYDCEQAILSSVGFLKKSEIKCLSEKINLIILNESTKIPIKNNYATPKTLGTDRIALAVAANFLYPKKNTLIIDAGTCITYDFVSDNGVYQGGAISPGIEMRYKSLNYFTNSLPLLKAKLEKELIGNNTNKSIHIGVSSGVINEIDSFIQQYRKKNKDLTVVLTGGAINFLKNKLKNVIFANPNFLMIGLNQILTYNLDK
ncbi:MAG: type III pantothenate kinase [Lutibacter sp.]